MDGRRGPPRLERSTHGAPPPVRVPKGGCWRVVPSPPQAAPLSRSPATGSAPARGGGPTDLAPLPKSGTRLSSRRPPEFSSRCLFTRVPRRAPAAADRWPGQPAEPMTMTNGLPYRARVCDWKGWPVARGAHNLNWETSPQFGGGPVAGPLLPVPPGATTRPRTENHVTWRARSARFVGRS